MFRYYKGGNLGNGFPPLVLFMEEIYFLMSS